MLPIWKRNLLMLWCSQLMVMAGYDAMMPFVPLFLKNGLVLQDTATLAYYISLYNIAGYVGYGIGNPLWGWLGDRYGTKPMLLRGTFLTAFIWPLMGYVHSPMALVILRFISAFLAGTTSASQMMLSRTAPVEHLGFAMGTLSTAIWGGSMFGSMVGGSFISKYGFRFAFWSCGVMYFLAGISIIFTSDKASATLPKLSSSCKATAPSSGGWRSLNTTIWCVLLLCLLEGVVRRIEGPFLALRIEDLVGMKRAALTTGWLSSILGVGAILSGLCFGTIVDKYSSRRLITPILSTMAILLFLQGSVDLLSCFVAARTLQYFIAGAISPMIQKMIAANTTVNQRGLSLGLATTAASVGGIAAASIGGLLLSHYSISGVFIGTAIITIFAIPFYQRIISRAEMNYRSQRTAE